MQWPRCLSTVVTVSLVTCWLPHHPYVGRPVSNQWMPMVFLWHFPVFSNHNAGCYRTSEVFSVYHKTSQINKYSSESAQWTHTHTPLYELISELCSGYVRKISCHICYCSCYFRILGEEGIWWRLGAHKWVTLPRLRCPVTLTDHTQSSGRRRALVR